MLGSSQLSIRSPWASPVVMSNDQGSLSFNRLKVGSIAIPDVTYASRPTCNATRTGEIRQIAGQLATCNSSSWIAITPPGPLTRINNFPLTQPRFPRTCNDIPIPPAQQGWYLLQPVYNRQPAYVHCDWTFQLNVSNPSTKFLRGWATVWVGCPPDSTILQPNFIDYYGNPNWVGFSLFQSLMSRATRIALKQVGTFDFVISDAFPAWQRYDTIQSFASALSPFFASSSSWVTTGSFPFCDPLTDITIPNANKLPMSSLFAPPLPFFLSLFLSIPLFMLNTGAWSSGSDFRVTAGQACGCQSQVHNQNWRLYVYME